MIILFLLLVLLLLLYNKSKDAYLKGLLVIFVVGKFVLFKLGYYYTPTIYNILGVSVILISFSERVWSKYKVVLFLSFSLYFFYFFMFPIVVWGASISKAISSLIDYKAACIYLLLGAICLEWKRKGLIHPNILLQFLNRIVFLQVFLVILQYIFPFVSDFFVIRTYEYGGQVYRLLDESFDNASAKICTGTMLDPGSVSMFLSVGIVFYLFSQPRLTKRVLGALLIFAGAIVLCGVRAPLLVSIVGVAIYFLKAYRIKLKYIVLTIGIAVAFLMSVGNLATIGQTAYKDASREDPLTRALSSAIIFSSSEDVEQTTISLTLLLIPKIFESPIIGNGLHVSGRNYSLGGSRLLEDYSITDAGAVFFLAEYGIIGLLIFLLPILYFFRIYKHNNERYKLILIFILIVMNSIVDAAFNSEIFMYLFFITPMFLELDKRPVLLKKSVVVNNKSSVEINDVK